MSHEGASPSTMERATVRRGAAGVVVLLASLVLAAPVAAQDDAPTGEALGRLDGHLATDQPLNCVEIVDHDIEHYIHVQRTVGKRRHAVYLEI